MKSEAIQLIKTPPLIGPLIENLLTVRRIKGKWRIEDFQFDPKKYPSQKAENNLVEPTIFTPTENGFIFEGFVYDRRVMTPEQRSWLLDALKQATHEIETDSGKKTVEGDDFMKMIK